MVHELAEQPLPPSVFERFAVAGLSALFLHLIVFRRGVLIYTLIDQGDGGFWIDEADRVLRGEVPYRDFFEFVGPGILYLNAAVLLLCGPAIGAFGWAGVLVGAALAGLVHSLSARLMGPPWRWFAATAFVVLVYAPYSLGNHKWPALFFALLGLRRLVDRDSGSRLGAAGAGVLFGTAALFTQDLGFGVAAGTAAHFLTKRPERPLLGPLALGFLVPLALGLGALAVAAGPSVVLYDCFVFPLTQYGRANPFRLAFLGYHGPRAVAQVVLSLGGLAAALALAGRNAGAPADGEHTRRLRLLAFAGLGCLLATAHRGLNPARLAVFSSLMIVPLFEVLSRRRRHRLRPLAAATLAVLGVGAARGSVGLVLERQFLDPMTRETHRAGEVWVAKPMPEVSWLESRTEPDDATFVLPGRGGIHFLTRTRNPTRFPYLSPTDLHTEEQVRQVLAEILAARPAIGLWEKRDPSPALAPLREGILAAYDAEESPSGTLLLRRKAPHSPDGPTR